MKKFYFSICITFCLGIGVADAQFSLLLNFTGANGNAPFGSLIRFGNKFFGMTKLGGSNGDGNIFSIDTDGSNYFDLWDFQYAVTTNGSYPYGSLTVVGNKLFGMTEAGGANEGGIIFCIDSNGTAFTDLLDFAGAGNPMGSFPYGNLTPVGGVLFGLTELGGANGQGVVFSIDTNGAAYKVLFDFAGANGANPVGALTLVGGKFYGLTSAGAANGDGNIFSIDTNGTNYMDMHDFSGPDGSTPRSTLTYFNGILYGTAEKGGANGDGNVFRIDTNGAGFKDLLDFNITNGLIPYFGNLILAGSQLFGMAEDGGAYGDGLIYSVDTNGAGYQNRLDFNTLNGDNPCNSLLLSGGLFYGMTSQGGIDDQGVVFVFDTTAKNTAGIQNFANFSGGINVYPNPGNGKYNIGISDKEQGISEMQVYNIMGEKIAQFTIDHSQFTIDLSSQPCGVYLYRIISESGSLTSEGKLIIQK